MRLLSTLLLYLAYLLVCAGTCSAADPKQAPPPPAAAKEGATTQLRQFLDQRGVLVVKDFNELDAIDLDPQNLHKGAAPSRLHATAISAFVYGKESLKVKGFEVSLFGPDARIRIGTVYLDLAEAERLSEALRQMIQEYAKGKKEGIGYRVYEFRSLEGFAVATSWNAGQSLMVEARNARFTALDDAVTPIPNLGAIKNLIDLGLIWLNRQ